MPGPELETPDSFVAYGIQIKRRIVMGDALLLVREYCRLKKGAIKPLYSDGLCPDSYSVYSDVMSESLLVTLQPRFEEACGESLVPSFSYLRIYGKGCKLPAHVDRPACEISGSLTIESSGETSWQLMFSTDSGPIGVELDAGDLVVYRGSIIPHWRDKFMGDYHAQIILNYVIAGGLNSTWALDRRPKLGYPIGPETISAGKRGGVTPREGKTHEDVLGDS